MAKSVEHPRTRAAFSDAAGRWNRLKDSHRAFVDRLWAGTMATEFTAFELSLLARNGYMSERDRQLLMQMRANGDWS